MREKIIDFGLGLVAGVMACGILFLFFELFKYPESFLFGTLLSVLFLPIIEEIFKYIPLRLPLFKENYVLIGIGIGLGFALIENLIYSTILGRIKPSLLHIATGLIMGYFVSKKKDWIGLLIAITLHSLYNFSLAGLL